MFTPGMDFANGDERVKRATARLLLITIGGAALASGSVSAADTTTALSVSDSVTIQAAPDIVWSTVRDYDAPSVWDPFITSATITHGKNNKPGAKRDMNTSDGGTIKDKLTAWNADKRMFATRMTQTTLPIRSYHDRISVEPTRKGARLTWKAEFKPAHKSASANARHIVKHRITRALAHVKAMLGTANSAQPKTTAAPSAARP